MGSDVAAEKARERVVADLMSGAPPFGPERLVTLENWQTAPSNRWGFQHAREMIPTATIRRGSGPVWDLPREPHDVLGMTFCVEGIERGVDQFLNETQTDGFLVVHRGRVVAEHYFNEMEPDTPHVLMSVSKSITAAVTGILVERGQLDVDAPITDLVPELRDTAFAGATARHLLDMRAGIEFNEDYDDLDADVRIYEEVYQLRPRRDLGLPTDALSYFASLRRAGEHGGPFRYSSILTDVLAWVLERAADERFHSLVSRTLWSRIGAEFDAEVTLDAYGNAMADGGMSATLRDLGRFGLQYLVGGASHRPQVVPASWVRDTVRGAPDGRAVFRAFEDQPGFPSESHYRSCWWIRNADAPYFHASGIYGQSIFVHGPTDTVVVKLSSWATPLDRRLLDVTATAVVAIGVQLSDVEVRP